MARIWIVSTIPVPPEAQTTQKFGLDKEAARAFYITKITDIGAPADKIQSDSAAVLTDATTLQYTNPTIGTRIVLTTTRN